MIDDSQALNGGDYEQLLSCVVHLSLETLILEEISHDPPLALKFVFRKFACLKSSFAWDSLKNKSVEQLRN